MEDVAEGLEGRGPIDAAESVLRLDVVAPPEFNGKRLDTGLVALFEARNVAASRSELARWIRAGLVLVDGAAAKPSTALVGGERIVVEATRPPRFDWTVAEALDFGIVFEDESVLVVDKPAGLAVHPGAGNPRGTLVNGLLHRRPALAKLPRAGLVHRLDKDTSGLLVVAGDQASQLRLIEALSEHRVERRYLAVVEGRMIAAQRIDLPLGRDPRNRLRQAVRRDGRRAVTHVSIRQRFAAHTLVEARLETGRTHQVRVHMAARRHPLVGDTRYGARGIVPPKAQQAAVEVVRGFSRQALHAFRLGFAHPSSGQPLAFESSPPRDLRALLEALAS